MQWPIDFNDSIHSLLKHNCLAEVIAKRSFDFEKFLLFFLHLSKDRPSTKSNNFIFSQFGVKSKRVTTIDFVGDKDSTSNQ